MDVTVNGVNTPVREGVILSELLRDLRLAPEQMGTAVAVNDEVIPRGRWDSSRLRAGDRIEIVRPVQGG